jgi:putative transposase
MNRIPIEVGEWYHCYNRGVDKRKVFASVRDYDRFLTLLFLANGYSNKRVSNVRKMPLSRLLGRETLERGAPLVEIGAYALMPNHVHFIVKEVEEGGIASFMQKIFTGYTMYFNTKHERTGALFAGTYKSKHLSTDRYFKHAINYVHMNPIELYEPNWKQGAGSLGAIEEKLRAYKYSSLQDHIGIERAEKKILGTEVFTLFDTPSSLSTMLFDAQAYYRDTSDWL